ncbi:MAG: tetratricopeptide repeat protein [Myxococcota bacterium]
MFESIRVHAPSVLLWMMIVLHYACPAAADAYTDALARATSLEARGQLAEAAAVLETLEADYPQDYSLALYLGWLKFQAEQYDVALVAYRKALKLSPESIDAKLGEGWTLVRLGDRSGAEAAFAQVLARSPDHAGALEGLALAQNPEPTLALEDGGPLLWLTQSAGVTAHRYGGHPFKEQALGIALGFDAVSSEGWTAGLSGRLTAFTGAATATVELPGMPAGPGLPPETITETITEDVEFRQAEVYGRAGWQQPQWGVEARAAYVDDSSEASFDATVFGLKGQLTDLLPGTLALEVNTSLYSDLTLIQATPAWRLMLGSSGWFIEPGATVVVGDGDSWVSGSGQVGWLGERGSVWAGGWYGDLVRPVYFDQPAVYNLDETMRYGAWAGAGWALGDGDWSVVLAYAWNHLRDDSDDGDGQESEMHLMTLGLGVTF